MTSSVEGATEYRFTRQELAQAVAILAEKGWLEKDRAIILEHLLRHAQEVKAATCAHGKRADERCETCSPTEGASPAGGPEVCPSCGEREVVTEMMPGGGWSVCNHEFHSKLPQSSAPLVGHETENSGRHVSHAELAPGGLQVGGSPGAETESAGTNLLSAPMVLHILVKERTDKNGGKAWVAHCLELDLVGVDAEKWRAVEKIGLLINRQVEFGIRNHREDNIWFPAPKEYFAELPCSRGAEGASPAGGPRRHEWKFFPDTTAKCTQCGLHVPAASAPFHLHNCVPKPEPPLVEPKMTCDEDDKPGAEGAASPEPFREPSPEISILPEPAGDEMRERAKGLPDWIDRETAIAFASREVERDHKYFGGLHRKEYEFQRDRADKAEAAAAQARKDAEGLEDSVRAIAKACELFMETRKLQKFDASAIEKAGGQK